MAINKTKNSTKLTMLPIENFEFNKIYVDEIIDVLETEKDVTNIAITGDYGSGKSSVIKSIESKVKEKFSNKKILKISLASLNTEQQTKNIKNEEIEQSIIQQLLYSSDCNELPFSHINRIKKDESIAKRVIKIFLIIISFIILFLTFSEGFRNYVINNFQNIQNLLKLENTNNVVLVQFSLILSIIVIVIGAFLIKCFLEWMYTLNKFIVKVPNVELNFECKDDKYNGSLFNQYIDELIYFFCATDNNLIIIEDLDRFNDTNIFLKLRETNIIINNNVAFRSGKKDKIVFVYAVRDDLFENEDRTKFFDYIIPIIPVITKYNSIDKLEETLNLLQIPIEYQPDAVCKNYIFVYLKDMRIIKNICNEYNIYLKQLNKNNFETPKIFEPNKLFALIVYKNLKSRDFANMQKGKGNINSLINLRGNLEAECKKNIKICTNKRFGIEKDRTEKMQALKMDILKEYETQFSNKIQVDGKQYTTDELRKDSFSCSDLFSCELKRPTEHIFKISELDETISVGEKKFRVRYQEIIEEFTKQLEIIDENISREYEKIDKYRDGTLAEIFNEKSVLEEYLDKNINSEQLTEHLLEISEVLKNDILLALVSSGYIGEEYYLYTNNTYGNNLTNEEYMYISNNINQYLTDYDLKIRHFEYVIGRIPNLCYERKYILNYDLVSGLCDSKKQHKQKLHKIILMLNKCKFDEEIFKFIPKFIEINAENEEVKNIFLKEVVDNLQDLFVYINKYYSKIMEDPKAKIDEWIINILNNSLTKNNIFLLIKDTIFLEHLDNIQDISQLKTSDSYFQILTSRGKIKFTSIIKYGDNIKKLRIIFRNNAYEINTNMINLIFKMYRLDNVQMPYKTLLELNKNCLEAEMTAEAIKNYILKTENINLFIYKVYLNYENLEYNVWELRALLNNPNVSEENKNLLLNKYRDKVKIKDIRIIDSQYWKRLIDTNLVRINMFNIDKYILQIGIDKELIDSVNKYLKVPYLKNKNTSIKTGNKIKKDNNKKYTLTPSIEKLIQTEGVNSDIIKAIKKNYEPRKRGLNKVLVLL